MKHNSQKGFTLIELLVVISIIGLLSSVVLATLGSARVRARDARRLADVQEMRKALEFYHSDHGYYPKFNYAHTGALLCGGNPAWCSFRDEMKPYLANIADPLGANIDYRYWYDSDTGDSNQSYGFMVRLEHPGNYERSESDRGFWSGTSNGKYLEIGQQPSYCVNNYSAGDRNWLGPATVTNVCKGGN